MIALSQLKNIIVIRPEKRFIICMNLRPLIIVKFVVENLALEERLDLDSFLDNKVKVFFEQERALVAILKLDNIVNNQAQSSHLISFQSIIQCGSIKILYLLTRMIYFRLDNFTFLNFYFVK